MPPGAHWKIWTVNTTQVFVDAGTGKRNHATWPFLWLMLCLMWYESFGCPHPPLWSVQVSNNLSRVGLRVARLMNVVFSDPHSLLLGDQGCVLTNGRDYKVRLTVSRRRRDSSLLSPTSRIMTTGGACFFPQKRVNASLPFSLFKFHFDLIYVPLTHQPCLLQIHYEFLELA